MLEGLAAPLWAAQPGSQALPWASRLRQRFSGRWRAGCGARKKPTEGFCARKTPPWLRFQHPRGFCQGGDASAAAVWISSHAWEAAPCLALIAFLMTVVALRTLPRSLAGRSE